MKQNYFQHNQQHNSKGIQKASDAGKEKRTLALTQEGENTLAFCKSPVTQQKRLAMGVLFSTIPEIYFQHLQHNGRRDDNPVLPLLELPPLHVMTEAQAQEGIYKLICSQQWKPKSTNTLAMLKSLQTWRINPSYRWGLAG